MNPSSWARLLPAGILCLLLVGTTAAFAAPPTPLSVTTGGTVSNLGNQSYNVGGNRLVNASVDGFVLNPATTTFKFNMNANVNGVDTSGRANIQLRGTLGAPVSSTLQWTSDNGGTFTPQPTPPHGPGGSTAAQGCSPPDHDGQVQCQAQFTAGASGVTMISAAYPGDGYNSPSSDSYTIFVGNTTSSPSTSTSVTCDQAYLSAGQSTNCRATVTAADSSAATGTVAWTSDNGGTFTPQPTPPHGPGGSTAAQGCSPPDHDGQVQCQAQFTAANNGPVTVTATYVPASSDTTHAGSSDSYTLFVGTPAQSTLTSTSLVCDQDRLNLNQRTNCHATILTAYGSTTITLTATVSIDGQYDFPGSATPLGCDLVSVSTCNSLLPTFFTGGANVQVNIGNGPPAPPNAPGTQTQMYLESPYWNPFGGPLVIASADGSIYLVTTYNVGTVDWTGSQTTSDCASLSSVVPTCALGMFGTLGTGSSPNLVGTFTSTSNEHENLVAGTASDTGTMTFSDVMSPLSATPMNFTGHFQGRSTIPTDGGNPSSSCLAEQMAFGVPCTADCSTMAQGMLMLAGIFPPATIANMPPTCTMTGFESTGMFSLHLQKAGPHAPPQPGQGPAQDNAIMGSYQTDWTVPAIGFVSESSANVA